MCRERIRCSRLLRPLLAMQMQIIVGIRAARLVSANRVRYDDLMNSTSDAVGRVIYRFLFFSALAANVFLLPGVHGMFPVVAPNIVVFPQELSFFSEVSALYHYPQSRGDSPAVPIAPELLAVAAVTALWARMASPAFWRRWWAAYILASLTGVAARLGASLVPGLWWLPISIWTFAAILVAATVAILFLAFRIENTSRQL
jgi:hypothetical protein